ncbi:uncharacterized protein LOC135210509 [Macrobrachium nipponense]|uniref:uncharacterized protein LOC135210509 n=1 Tax=Macrobrachium nipponense TaxID=159736 RepID=UPI0030C8BD80
MAKFSAVLMMALLALSAAQFKKECKDPKKMLLAMYGIICDTDNCGANAQYCMDLMEPPIDLCNAKEQCKQEMLGSGPPRFPPFFNGGEGKFGPMFGMIKECVAKKIQESVGVEYLENNRENNTINYLNALAMKKPEFPEGLKTALLDAASSEKCGAASAPSDAAPGDEMMDDLKYRVCILKACVTAKANM